MAELDNTIRVIQSAASGRDKVARGATAKPEALTRSLTLTFAPGDRVLDLVTGQEGTIVDGQRQNVIVPAAGNAAS